MPDTYLGRERTTKQVHTALQAAVAVAVSLQHATIGPEHLVLGLLSLPTGLAAAVLHDLPVDAATAHAHVASMDQTPLPVGQTPPLRDTTLTVLTTAIAVADAWQHHYCGAEHLLVALARWPDPPFRQLCFDIGLIPIKVEFGVLHAMFRGETGLAHHGGRTQR